MRELNVRNSKIGELSVSSGAPTFLRLTGRLIGCNPRISKHLFWQILICQRFFCGIENMRERRNARDLEDHPVGAGARYEQELSVAASHFRHALQEQAYVVMIQSGAVRQIDDHGRPRCAQSA